MPNGKVPQSQEDKEWKLAVDNELASLRREYDILKRKLDALLRRS